MQSPRLGPSLDFIPISCDTLLRALTELRGLAFVTSLLEYSIIVWGGLYRSDLEPLCVAQCTIIKIILNVHPRYPSSDLFQTISVLPGRHLYVKYLLQFIQKSELSVSLVPGSEHSYDVRTGVGRTTMVSSLCPRPHTS